MKHLTLPGALVLLALATGCASSPNQPGSEAPDGLYIRSDGSVLSYPMRLISPRDKKPVTLDIQEYNGFVPEKVEIIERPQACLIQISGRGVATNWSEQGIFLVVNHIPFWQLRKSPAKPAVPGKSPASPATIFMAAGNRREAEIIAAAIRQRYSLLPEPGSDMK